MDVLGAELIEVVVEQVQVKVLFIKEKAQCRPKQAVVGGKHKLSQHVVKSSPQVNKQGGCAQLFQIGNRAV